jgi:hypothetical protein
VRCSGLYLHFELEQNAKNPNLVLYCIAKIEIQLIELR